MALNKHEAWKQPFPAPRWMEVGRPIAARRPAAVVFAPTASQRTNVKDTAMAANQDLQYDVFLSHSAKDKAVVCVPSLSASNGERAGVRCRSPRLRQDGPFKLGFRISDFGFAQPGLSANAFGSDWAQLLTVPQPSTLNYQPTGAPLNKERRFIPLRLDDAPIKGGACKGTTASVAALGSAQT